MLVEFIFEYTIIHSADNSWHEHRECNKSEFVDSLVILLINSILNTHYTLPTMYILCKHNDDLNYL